MAKPLEFIPTPPTPEERLQNEVLDSGPALEESLKLLRELHEHGVLELLIKVVRGGEGLGTGVLQVLGSDQVLIGMRSIIEFARVLGNLHPDDLRQLTQGLGAAAEQGALNASHGVKVTPLELPKLLLDPDVQLALGSLFGVLQGLGRGLRQAQEERQHS